MPTPGTLRFIGGLVPAMRAAALAFIRACEARGWRVTICRGACSSEEQARVHAENPTGSAAPGHSLHEKGEAFDVCFLNPDGSWNFDETQPWDALGELGESFGFDWGGRWRKGRWANTLGDRPHFQRRGA